MTIATLWRHKSSTSFVWFLQNYFAEDYFPTHSLSTGSNQWIHMAITGDHRRSLEITGDHWRSLGIPGDHWGRHPSLNNNFLHKGTLAAFDNGIKLIVKCRRIVSLKYGRTETMNILIHICGTQTASCCSCHIKATHRWSCEQKPPDAEILCGKSGAHLHDYGMIRLQVVEAMGLCCFRCSRVFRHCVSLALLGPLSLIGWLGHGLHMTSNVIGC